jgi:anti-anti-sigma factor
MLRRSTRLDKCDKSHKFELPDLFTPFEIHITVPAHGVTVLAASGELDWHSAPLLDRALEAMPPQIGGGTLTLDLRRVEFIDSAGLGVLIIARRRPGGGAMTLIIGRGGAVDLTLKMTRLGQILRTVYLEDGVDAAQVATAVTTAAAAVRLTAEQAEQAEQAEVTAARLAGPLAPATDEAVPVQEALAATEAEITHEIAQAARMVRAAQERDNIEIVREAADRLDGRARVFRRVGAQMRLTSDQLDTRADQMSIEAGQIRRDVDAQEAQQDQQVRQDRQDRHKGLTKG